MNKILKNISFALLLAAGSTGIGQAQSATEALRMSDTDLFGSARFVSMGGAFTSLGGDISSLSQNPAGIGVFRSSEVAATMNIAIQSTQIDNLPGNSDLHSSRVLFDNIGIVGTMRFGENATVANINFGAAYNRRQHFSQNYRVNYAALNGSLSNAIAGLCTDAPANLTYSSGAAWLDVLAYDNFLTRAVGQAGRGDWIYEGLYAGGQTSGRGFLDMQEKGYDNEYSFNFGGNIANRLFFGIGLGIDDLKYQVVSYYEETLADTQGETELTDDDGSTNFYPITASDYSLYNELSTRGTGVNFKVGLIGYITDSWRVGIAVHTPTYFSLTRTAYGDIVNDYIYTDEVGEVSANSESNTPVSETDFRLRTPMKVMAGTSYMFGTKAILSVDYEFTANKRMKMFERDGFEYTYDNQDIKDYLKNSHTIRVGAEYRILPQLSVRAGYTLTTTPVSDAWLDNTVYGPTAGTLPHYTLNRSKQAYSAGLGYRFKRAYIDAAYQHRCNKNEVMAYSAVPDKQISGAKNVRAITKNNNIIITFGVKF